MATMEHLAASVVRRVADGRSQVMAPATVNNHPAHLSALFTWISAHAPAEALRVSAKSAYQWSRRGPT